MTFAPRKAGRTRAFQSKKLLRVNCWAGGAPKAAARAELDMPEELDELIVINLKQKENELGFWGCRVAKRI
jgi:hypothetical protein